jgi:hypothetical protein
MWRVPASGGLGGRREPVPPPAGSTAGQRKSSQAAAATNLTQGLTYVAIHHPQSRKGEQEQSHATGVPALQAGGPAAAACEWHRVPLGPAAGTSSESTDCTTWCSCS